ncbi:MAG: hypothetical protein E3K32_01885 [wastewater metagenome]|nr:hypothetical protein [Candidatus Loosdrechtia aerotolerans]
MSATILNCFVRRRCFMKRIISLLGFTFLLFSQVFSFHGNVCAEVDGKGYKNFYGIAWCGKPEEDVKYAKQMGYESVVINPSSSIKDYHDNPDCEGLKFYLVDPFWYPEVLSGYSKEIDTTEPISDEARKFYNRNMVWKSNDPFPQNLATGYYPSRTSTKFSVMWDFQQQAVIDKVVEKIIAMIKRYENSYLSFTFGGYILNEPKLTGNFYRLDENGKNIPVSLSHWTGMNSGLVHGTITHEYVTYSDGLAAFYKILRMRIAQEFPDAKWITRSTWLYNEIDNNEWLYQIKDRADRDELVPDMLSQGSSQNTDFVDNANIFNIGLPVTKGDVGNSHASDVDGYKNRLIAAKAGINGAWFNWFGQFSDDEDRSDSQSITEVSPGLKLIRCIPNWDNLNNVPLIDRSWDGNIYQSTKSYASKDVIYSQHPRTGGLFAVFLTTGGVIKIREDEVVTSVQRTDDFFTESGDGFSDVTITDTEIRLKNKSDIGKGYIFMLSNDKQVIAEREPGVDETQDISDVSNIDSSATDSTDDGLDSKSALLNKSTPDVHKSPDSLASRSDRQAFAPMNWQQVPIRTAAQKAAGLSGGEGTQLIYTIAYAPSDPNIVYLTSDTSQVWKSTDSGATWKIANTGFYAKGGISLVVDPRNKNVVFVAGSVHTVSRSIRSKSSGIYRTTDGGKTWKQVKQTHYQKPSADEKGGVHFAFGSSSNVVYAGTHDQGILKSTNGGDTWTSLNVLTTKKINDVKSHPTNPSVLFVSTTDGLYRVTDNGGSASTRKIGSGLPTDPHTVVINPKNPKIIYAAVRQYGVYMSTNGGDSFSSRNNGLSELSLGKKVSYLSISPVDPNYLYVSFYASWYVYYTHNGGANWYIPDSLDDKNGNGYVSGSMVNPENPSYIGFLAAPTAFHPTNKNIALIAGNAYHIKKTYDGGVNWKFRSSGYTGAAVAWNSNSISWDPNNPDRFVFFLTDYGPYLTEDGGSTFRTLDVPKYGDKSTPVGALDPTPGSKVIVAAVGEWYTHVLCITRDNGQTWKQIMKDSNGNSTEDNYRFVAFNPQNPKVIYAGRFKSTDKGYTWKKLSKRICAMYPKDGNIVYSASSSNGVNTVYKSTDGGATWSAPYGSFKGSTGASIKELAVDPTNQNRLYAAVDSSGVFIYDGSKWIEKSSSSGLTKDWFGRQQTQTITVDPVQPNVIYIGRAAPTYGQSNGVFRSTDYGVTWHNVSYNIGPEININALNVNPHTGHVFAGSYHGVWKLPPPYTNQSDIASPTVDITSPTTESTYTTDKNIISLGGTASDNESVTSVTWTNNSDGTGTGSGIAQGTTSWSIPEIVLARGENIITVTARDGANNTSSDTITIHYTIPRKSLVAKRVTKSPFINGRLGESEWDISTSATKVITGTPDNEVHFGALWDDKNLYVGVKVLDNDLHNDSAEPWHDDTIEIYIDANYNHGMSYDKYDRQIMVRYKDSTLFSKQEATGIEHAWAATPEGYNVEVAIPWSNLGITPSAGMKIGFDIQNDDDDNGGEREHVTVWNGTEYNYCDTSAFGNLKLSATIAPRRPFARTLSEKDALSKTAMLRGKVNPGGSSTEVWFEYGTESGEYTDKTSAENIGSSGDFELVRKKINALTPGATYYYRIVAQNTEGTAHGVEKSFMTKPISATARTLSTKDVMVKTAMLRGKVNPGGSSTEVWFEYGTESGEYTGQTSAENIDNSGDFELVRKKINALTPGATYYYRVVAENNGGRVNGDEKSFTTADATLSSGTKGNI